MTFTGGSCPPSQANNYVFEQYSTSPVHFRNKKSKITSNKFSKHTPSEIKEQKKIRQKKSENKSGENILAKSDFYRIFFKSTSRFLKTKLDIEWSFIGFIFVEFESHFYRILFQKVRGGFLSDFYLVEQNISLFIKNIL